MSSALSYVKVAVDGRRSYQTIDGFGVNINSRYWDSPRFEKAMELLVDELGATLYRVDIWGKSNWVDPRSEADASVLNEATYRELYQGYVFQKGWAMMRYLNERGIEPYLTASGDVPRWMLAPDGRTLVHYDQFCEMLVSMVDWARNKEGIAFKYFSPLNETDAGSPEGPTVSAEDFVRVAEVLDAQLHAAGLDHIQLAVADQARFNTDYVSALIQSEALRQRIGVFAMHTYSDLPPEAYAGLVDLVRNSPCAGAGIWLSEYGDLDQTGEKEWYISWVSTNRLLHALEGGFTGALVWDAYDNYHDHDEFWTIYGLIRTGLRCFTPKKRFYAAKQVYRYVRPGFERLEVLSDREDLWALAFANPERTRLTLVGMNQSTRDLYINASVEGFADAVNAGKVSYYRTSEHEDCVRVGEVSVRTRNSPYTGIDVQIPAESIFTLTTEP